jgi:flagellar FliL protein
LLKDGVEMNKKKIIIAGALAGVLGAGAGVYFLMPGWLPEVIRPQSAADPKHAKKEEETKASEPEVGADLVVFVVNLAASNGPQRYLRMTLSLGVKGSHEKEEIKETAGPIRHGIIMYLSERTPEELADPEGKNKLRQQLLTVINKTIGHKLVSNVYFKEFLIQ